MAEPRRVKTVFLEAAERPAAERRAALDRLCAGDATLRAEVEGLLREHDGAGEFLGATRVALKAAGPAEGVGTRVGQYRLLELIGEGGFGSVFLAEQREPVARRVALKIIKLGMDTKTVIARFEAERQALALMEHPNIATVLDAGATETGRPYFVMELVRGEPITGYCDRSGLSVPERLKLFGSVCAAVQHAHTKGIIHRDLKPSNILVTHIDGRPSPKVIDFGIAKATSGRLTDKTLFTEHRQLIGTPEYMSPEQAETVAADIDTRSDVYSLGVLLYELLTGVTPFDSQRLRSAAWDEMLRVIREEEPPRPSTRLTQGRAEVAGGNVESAGSALDTGTRAARRRTDAAALSRLIRGDLDWIVMKCLEKDRTRRYETANGLAMDVGRYLAGEPVLAAPPSNLYRLRRFVRRHRMGAATGVAAVAGLALFGAFAAYQASEYAALAATERASRERADKAGAAASAAQAQATRERNDAVRAQKAEREQRQVAERETDRARTVTEIIARMVSLADPDVAGGSKASMRATLDTVAARVAELCAGDPDSEASLRTAIGCAYASLGELEPARDHLERALVIRTGMQFNDPARTLEVLGPYSAVLDESSDVVRFDRMGDVLPVICQVARATHPDVATAMDSLWWRGADIDQKHQQLMKIATATMPPDDQTWLVVAQYLSIVADLADWGGGWPERAWPLQRDAVAVQDRLLPRLHSRQTAALGKVARSLIRDGRYVEAAAAASDAVERLRLVFPADHWRLALARARLAACTREPARLDEARATLAEGHARVVAQFGPASCQAGEFLAYMVDLDDLAGDGERARRDRLSLAAALQGPEPFSDRIALRRAFGPEHAPVWEALHRLHGLAGAKTEEAAPAVEALIEARQRLIPDDHPLGAVIADQLAEWVNKRRNRFDDPGLRALREAELLARASPNMNPRKRSSVYWWLGYCLLTRGSPTDAEPLVRECLLIQETTGKTGGHFAAHSRWLLGDCLLGQARYAEAEPLLLSAYHELLDGPGLNDTNTRIALAVLLRMYRDWGKPREALAEVHRADLKSTFPPWDWDAWELTRFIFEDADPRLAEAVERVRNGMGGDTATIAALIEQAVAERRRVVPDIRDPRALLFTGYLWKLTDPTIYAGVPAWVWERFARDAILIFREHPGNHRYLAYGPMLAAMCAESRADYAEAESLSAEAIREYCRRVPENHSATMYLQARRASALLGLGRAEEAERLLVPGYRQILSLQGLAHAYTSSVLAALADLYARTGRPERASEILVPVLRQIGQLSRNADALGRMARVMSRPPGLGADLYSAALDLAEAACRAAPDDPELRLVLGAARFRAGRHAEAVESLEQAGGSRFPVQLNAWLAMARWRVGRKQEAAAALTTLRGLMGERVNAMGAENQALYAEAARMIEGRTPGGAAGPTR